MSLWIHISWVKDHSTNRQLDVLGLYSTHCDLVDLVFFLETMITSGAVLIKHKVFCFTHQTFLLFCVCVLTGGTSRASAVPSTVTQRKEKPVCDSASGALQRPKPANVRAAWL